MTWKTLKRSTVELLSSPQTFAAIGSLSLPSSHHHRLSSYHHRPSVSLRRPSPTTIVGHYRLLLPSPTIVGHHHRKGDDFEPNVRGPICQIMVKIKFESLYLPCEPTMGYEPNKSKKCLLGLRVVVVSKPKLIISYWAKLKTNVDPNVGWII